MNKDRSKRGIGAELSKKLEDASVRRLQQELSAKLNLVVVEFSAERGVPPSEVIRLAAEFLRRRA